MPVLSYSKKERLFLYPQETLRTPYGLKVVNVQGKRYVGFADWYPYNYLQLKRFQKSYGAEAKASKGASERISEIKEAREEFGDDKKFLKKYRKQFAGKPYAHQVEAVRMMQLYDRLALLLEQGMGKTYISLIALRILKKRKLVNRVLIVCPKIVYYSWLSEISKFTPEMRVKTYMGDPSQREMQRKDVSDFDILLTTYDMVSVDGSKKLTSGQLVEAWMRLDDKGKEEFANRWVDNRLITIDEPPVLVKTRNKAWLSKVLKNIPESFLPQKEIRDVQQEDSSARYLKSLGFDMLVVDEASRVINPKAQRSTVIETLARETPRVYLLSGTLCLGRPTDMYMPMDILDYSIFNKSYYAFLNEYCCFSSYNRHIITGYKNLDRLKKITEPYILCRERKECLDLPERTIVPVYYQPKDSIVGLYNAIASKGNSEIDLKEFGIRSKAFEAVGSIVHCGLVIQKIQKCMQLLNGFIHIGGCGDSPLCGECSVDRIEYCVMNNVRPGGKFCGVKTDKPVPTYVVDVGNEKLELLREDLEDILPREKVIIWAWYRRDIDKIRKLLEDMKVKYLTPEVEDSAGKFEASNDIRVYLGQTAQGIGITLNSATITIYYSHGTALEPRLQSMDRNMRIGQKNPVVVRDYVCPHSVEEFVVKLLDHKADVKNFMQASIRCMGCQSLDACLSNGIQYLKRGCVYYGMRKQAEEKLTIQIPLLEEGL